MSLKVCVVGPKGTSKSVIANFLANQADHLVADRYEPTAGVRILECEVNIGGSAQAVEIWDASGDQIYEGCWRSIMHDADGVILVYNPDAPSQDQQIGDWYDFFVKKNGLKDEQTVVFAHRTDLSNGERFRPPPLFSKVNAALTTPDSGQEMRQMFETLLKDVVSAKRKGGGGHGKQTRDGRDIHVPKGHYEGEA
jgi:hypothetical protein